MESNKCIILFVGILFIILSVKLIKNIIKQERPIKKKTYGMPSSRSSLISFILTYLILNNNYDYKTKFTLCILTSIAIIIKYIYKEHTAEQLIIGSIYGYIVGYILYCLGKKIIIKL